MNGELETTLLWEVFASTSDDEARANVRRLVDNATGILDRIVETFPTYTLHNHVHALNVVRLMGGILGPACSKLTGLESALLILAAYYHDIGMYFREDERASLTEEEWFDDFLRTHPTAYIDYVDHGRTVTADLAEQYCRWRHADRVYHFLNLLSDDELRWGVVPLREKLGEICRSHNQRVAFLKDDDIFETNFLQQCDVRLCAILLRLADILDFDRSRSPELVYSYLDFSHGDSNRLRRSNEEWVKHLQAQGFTFPAERSESYTVSFIASPDEPTIEHDIRAFLDTIDDELTECRSLLKSCSPRWRDLPLPLSVFRDIRPRGYKYGGYRFELDRHQVLSLFMGENLYSNTYVFIRELLQNAIDTSRHRNFFEYSQGNRAFEPAPIEVSEWLDDESYRWVRIDDYGMGMDEHLMLDYFLSVGSSYYRSADFRAEMLRYTSQEGQPFLPISRFGIGILSCFIIGDRVEVSSRRARVGGTVHRPVRLSLRGLESFYILQADPMPPRPMPSQLGDDKGYRGKVGTSIAVRFDPAKDPGDFDLAGLLRRFILASPIPVTYRGEPLVAAHGSLVTTPWFDGEHSMSIPRESADDTQAADQDPYQVVTIPLDLTSASPDTRFRGQMAIIALLTPSVTETLEPDPTLIRSPRLYPTSSGVRSGRWDIELVRSGKSHRIDIDLAELFGTAIGRNAANSLHTALAWSHNGVALPGLIRVRTDEGDDAIEGNGPTSFILELGRTTDKYSTACFVGCWSFADELQVDISASRDVVIRIPWYIRSLIQFTVYRACVAADHDLATSTLRPLAFDMDLISDFPSLRIMMDDPLVARENGWCDVPVLALKSKPLEKDMTMRAKSITSYYSQYAGMVEYHTVSDVRRRIASQDHTYVPALPPFEELAHNRPEISFEDILSTALMRTSVGLAWAHNEETNEWEYILTGPAPIPITDGEAALPPLYILPYIKYTGLRGGQGPLNRDHPFTQWLMEAIIPLQEHHPSVLALLLKDLATSYDRSAAELHSRIYSINTALERLRRLNFSPSPPMSISLTSVDFSF